MPQADTLGFQSVKLAIAPKEKAVAEFTLPHRATPWVSVLILCYLNV